MRLPALRLASQLWLWLVLNVALIALLFILLLGPQAFGFNLLLTQPVREHLVATAARVAKSLDGKDESQWPAALAELSTSVGASLECCGADGHDGPQGPEGRGGPPDQPPPDFRTGGHEPPSPMPGDMPGGPQGLPPPFGPPPGERNGPPGAGAPPGELTDEIRLRHPRVFGGYQLAVPALVKTPRGSRRVFITFRVASATAMLRLLGIGLGLLFPLLAVLVSVIWWLPMIWRITRGIGRVTDATQRIAQGRFDERLPVRGRDELAQLSESVNDMAARLQGHLEAQKRFLSDAAHELTSPLARMQIGHGLLESQLPPAAQELWADIQDDARQMSLLLHELLLFSRAGLVDPAQSKEPVALREVALAAVAQEARALTVAVEIAPELRVRAEAALLQRALANLLRNAVRYGQADVGGVTLSAVVEASAVKLTVRDRGPGVPPTALARLGEAFYRPEAARTREGGGFGLGLAIVRRCVSACGGTVAFGNREGGGFETEITLARA